MVVIIFVCCSGCPESDEYMIRRRYKVQLSKLKEKERGESKEMNRNRLREIVSVR